MNKATKGLLLTGFAATIWGIAGTFAQYLFSNNLVDPLWITNIRMFFSGLILISYCSFKYGSKVKDILFDGYSAIKIALFGLIGLTSSQLTYYMAINYSNAGTATVLQYLGPTLIVFYVCVTQRRFPKYAELIAIALAVSGTFIVATRGNLNSLSISREALTWGLLSALAMMTYTVMPGKLIEKWGSAIVNAYAMLFAGTILLFIIRPWTYDIVFSFKTVFSIIVIVFLGTAIGYTLYLQGVTDIGPVAASTIACIEPISATICSGLFLNTIFLPIDILGFSLIMISVIIVAISKSRMAKSQI
ncbi:MAG: EamA family transporter [Tissierellia bacterium]|nr:EamA family transporter [Tissierellia bacterium]